MLYRVGVHIAPRRGILDPQGKAIADALHSLGFETLSSARVGKHIVLEMTATDANEAGELARTMCSRLLANPVTENFDISTVERA